MALLAQFRADQNITLNGSDVSDWGDMANSNDAAQSTAINQPEYISSGHNGHPCVSFDGTEWLEAATNSVLEIGAGDITIVAVVKGIGDEPYGAVCGKGDATFTGNNAGYAALNWSANGNFHGKYASGGARVGYYTADGTTSADTLHVLETTLDVSGPTANTYVDGTLENDFADNFGTVTTIANSGTFKIGWVASYSLKFVGQIYEIRIYDSVESSVYSELNDRYSSQYSSGDDASGGILTPAISKALSDITSPSI